MAMRLSIIIPAHNEEENIGSLIDKVEQIKGIDFELLVVNDHSTDSTGRIVLEKTKQFSNIRLVENELDPSFANALRTGFANFKGDLVLPLMADLCDDLYTINKMYAKINEGYDLVCGSRYMGNGLRLGGSKFKSFLSSMGGRSLHLILGIPTHDIANAFKMYRKEVIKAVDIKATGFEISMEIPLKAHYLGFKIAEVPTVWRERTKGKSSFRIIKLLPSYLRLYFWGIYKSLISKRGKNASPR